MKGATAIVLVCVPASASALSATEATFTLPSGVNVRITEAAFKRTLFNIVGCTGEGTTCRINGRPPFGSVVEIPNTYVKNISIAYQGQSYSLDSSDMYDAWGARPLEVKGAVRYFGGKCSDSKNCRFRGVFSDGAGSFVAEWRVVDGRPNRTVLTDSNDIVKSILAPHRAAGV